MPPLVAICLLLRGGPLSARLGKRRLAVASLLALGGASLILALALTPAPYLGSGFWALVVALAVLGAGMGLFETAVNGAAMDWESERRAPPPQRPPRRLQRGGRGGGHRGRAAARPRLAPGRDPPPPGPPRPGPGRGHPGRLLPRPGRHPRPGTSPRRPRCRESGCGSLFRGPLLLLAAIAALGSVGESVANLWSVIYLSELGAGAVAGGAAFALANAAMLAGRVLNGPLVARHGARPSLLLSGAGLLLASGLLLLPGVPLAVAGFALTGLAVAGIVPTTLSAAGRLAPGHSGAVSGGLMAAVYLAFAVCPPLVGWLAERASLQAALLVVGLSGAGILGLT